MNANDVAAHWESNAETWTIYSRAGYDKYRDALNTPAFLDMLLPVAGLAGLDLGCGEGSNTRAVARLGARMTGLDIAPTFIRYARETEAEAPLGIDYVLGDGQSIDFPEASFDFVRRSKLSASPWRQSRSRLPSQWLPIPVSRRSSSTSGPAGPEAHLPAAAVEVGTIFKKPNFFRENPKHPRQKLPASFIKVAP